MDFDCYYLFDFVNSKLMFHFILLLTHLNSQGETGEIEYQDFEQKLIFKQKRLLLIEWMAPPVVS